MRLKCLSVCRAVCCVLILLLMSAASAFSLEPDQILVLANTHQSDSVRLAEYYMKRRGIPLRHLLKLSLETGEHCSRDIYNQDVVQPVRKYLKKSGLKKQIRCLVTMYGLPLKVAGPPMDTSEKTRLEMLRNRKEVLEKRREEWKDPRPDEKRRLEKALATLQKGLTALLLEANRGAAFDSELALALEEDYSLSGWIPNPLFLGYRGKQMAGMPARVLMVSRLDAPSPSLVRRMIDDSLAVEKTGCLQGKAYFDARYAAPKTEPVGRKELNLYQIYDQALYKAAEIVRRNTSMRVVVNEKPALFQAGECPEAAIFCGWYSLGKYVDAFEWQSGAVAYHIASSECATLKKAASQVWCKRMIEEGVAATLGPVDEPYLSAFPPPDLFFTLLLRGDWTLAECYALSQPFWSWKMVLIGDPLYRPFPCPESSGG